MTKKQREALSKRIRRLRGKRSQGVFAQEIGVYQQNICRYETGKSVPHVDILVQLAEHEDVDLHLLLTGKRYKKRCS